MIANLMQEQLVNFDTLAYLTGRRHHHESQDTR